LDVPALQSSVIFEQYRLKKATFAPQVFAAVFPRLGLKDSVEVSAFRSHGKCAD
jgi:hypothetical protein